MVLSLVPGMSITALAEETTDKTVAGLGTSAIGNPTSTETTASAWAGSYVYYGKYDGTNPTKYRVLDKASSDFGVSGGSLLLDCNTALYMDRFDSSSSKEWSKSSLRTGLNGDKFLTKSGNFTEQEKAAIASSTKTEKSANDGPGQNNYNFVSLSGEKVFVLDAAELTRTSYGYSSDTSYSNSGTRKKDNVYWQRSFLEGEINGANNACCVTVKGAFSKSSPSSNPIFDNVSPAFNVSLSSVIFASVITGTAGEAGAEYKLTLKDDALGIAVTSGIKANLNNNKLTIPYTVSGDNSANATQVSVLVTDKAYTDAEAQILKYGKLADVTSDSLSGRANFILPEGLEGTLGTNYHVYLLAEDVNGEKETDYANLKEITADDVMTHSHSFTYTASGATITATCSADGCTLENNTATLTIAPSSTGGSTAEFTGDTDEFDLTDVAITYKKKVGANWNDVSAETVQSATSEDNGFYDASATIVEGKTISVKYGISVITKGTGGGNGCSFEVPRVAGVGAKIKPTLTLATGYEVKKITVKDENGKDVSNAVSADTEGFTMPDYNITVDVAFGMIDYTITKNTMANGSVTVKNASEAVITTAHYGDPITLDVAPADHFTLKSLTVKDSSNKNVAVTGEGDTRTFTMPAYNITVSAEFEGNPFGITRSISPANGGTVAVSGTGVVTDNNDVTTAKAGSEVTLTVNAYTGFTLDSVTVKKANGDTVPVTDNKFTMPTEAVTVSATFAGHPTTATLDVTGNEGTTCTAKLLDANYKEVDSVTKEGGEQFILMANRDEGYGFTVTYGSNSPALLEEFTEEEYADYIAYAKENNLPVSSDMVLARVTMPGVEEDSVTLTVKFSKLKTFTILYQPSDTTTAVWCKFEKSGSTTAGASRMHNDAEMGDGKKVFSLKVTATDNPNQLAFVTTEDSLDSAPMITGVTVSQNTNTWNNIDGGKYLVIGGEAKTVVAAFVTDANAIPFYNSDRGKDPGPGNYGAGVTYRITVVANGNPGTVTAPAAPANYDESIQFAGWSALIGTAPNKAEIKCAAGETVQITENTSFNATWEPAELTVTLNLNGGTGVSGNQTVSYGDTLPTMEAPTKDSFAFDGWTVDETVIEGRYLYLKGSTFIPDTNITGDMGLTAKWKHVHTYTCYRLEEVGLDMFYDDNAVHVAFCSCYDYKLMAHEYDSDGMCACGKHKPVAGKVQLDVSYVQLINGNYTVKFKDKTRMEPQGKYVTLSASNLWGSDWSFSKWQYSTDMGNTWKDLAVTTAVKFGLPGVPCDMRVRAVYEESADAKPQVELSASKYDDHFEHNGISYPMANIAFQMRYKLPANYTFVDGGLRLGENDGIGYYDIKERTIEGNKAGIWAGCMVMHLLTFSTPEEPETSYTERYYELRKNSALDEMSPTELAKYIYEGKTTKAKIDPIYWDSKVKTEGNRGAIATRAPLNRTNAEDGNNWIYGIAWMRYKDSSGKIQTIYTDALATTLNGIVQGSSNTSVTKTAAN